MDVDRNIKVPDLILSTLLLSKTDIGLKRSFAKWAQFLNFVTLKMGVALHSRCSSPTIRHSGLILVLYARQITILSDYIIAG